ncbi:MAG: DUF371 domain-containing protein [Methanobacteriota archaeon]|nr:MAG: DUF371 domain-containing protein [Euryarchaeota archaeon]
MVLEVFHAFGHPNVRATHPTTLALTRAEELSLRGDCIVGVRADKACADVSPSTRRFLRGGNKVLLEFIVGGVKDVLVGYGHPDLTLESDEDVVIRKSRYVCGRTLVVGADKGAADLSRRLVGKLRSGEELVVVLRRF